MGDALSVCLMYKKDFKKEDFASFHPGGSLGKRLFVKVKDLMHTKDLPVVNEDTTLKDAVVVMSEGMLGNVLIEDKEDKLLAILSDGDLRRAVMRDDFSMDALALEYATKNPKVFEDENLLASDALSLVEEFKIQLIAILNEKQQVVGVLHIHDLIEAGIK
jgi:arabinose-5-phosphate isomerase